MEKAKDNFNLIVEYNIDTASNNYQERIDYYGDQNFDLIIAIGFMWNDAVIATAKKYPNSKFVIVDTELSESQNNAISILFDVDEAAFPLGFLSAWWADTHDSIAPKLGWVAALNIPQIQQFVESYNNGASYYNQQYSKSVETIGAYADDFFNEELGKHIADSLINLSADVIFGVGSETGNGSLLKAKELGKAGIGVDVDQYYSFPEVSDILLSSAMKGLDNAIYEVVKSFVDNTFSGGGIYNGKLANEGVGIAPYHDYESQIPDSIKIEIESIKAGIIEGSISTGW
jgi:basic membrane protein A